jgi:hypothetical protein
MYFQRKQHVNTPRPHRRCRPALLPKKTLTGEDFGFSLSGGSSGLPAGSKVVVDTMTIRDVAASGVLVENKDEALALTLAFVTLRNVSSGGGGGHPVW